MALTMPDYTFPRDMPLRNGFHPFESAQFEPIYGQVSAPTRGGRVQVANVMPPLWGMEFSSHLMPSDEAQDYLSWIQSLRGGGRLFKAWHPLCKYPRAYPAGWKSGFDGTGILTNIAAQRDEISVSDLPAGFKLMCGDMLSIPVGTTGRTLHRVMMPATASGLGVITAKVEPFIPLAVAVESGGPEVLFEKPWCLAVIDASSIRGPWEKGGFGRVSFSAVQTF